MNKRDNHQEPHIESRRLLTDAEAKSTSLNQPAFVSKPPGSPVYYGFPVVSESETDGWYYGAITDYLDSNGCKSGDGYVIAPDGTRAGLVWTVGFDGFKEICKPTPERWGVYSVGFVRPIKTTQDLVYNFKHLLPRLKRKHAELFGNG
jgi:hypothetical protein